MRNFQNLILKLGIHCDSPNSNVCNVCASSHHLQLDGTCAMGCSNGQYPTTTTFPISNPPSTLPSKICISCTGTNCLTCLSVTPHYCNSCISGKSISINSRACVDTCPDGQFSYFIGNSWFQCQNCPDLTCSRCNPTAPSFCLQCASGLFLKLGTCVSNCGDGFYADTQSFNCVACPQAGCKICSATTCSECTAANTYVFSPQNQVCGSFCPYNWQVYPDNLFICQPCLITNCKKCSPDRSFCMECHIFDSNGIQIQPPLFLTHPPNTAICSSTCKIGEYADYTTNKCIPCATASCSSCTAQTCLRCFFPKILYPTQNLCVTSCPDGSYKDPILNECLPCRPECSKCLNGQSCTACQAPQALDLITGLCKTCSLSQTEVIVDGVCYQCHNSCLTCSGKGQEDCLTCQSGLFHTITKRCIPPNQNPIKITSQIWDPTKSRLTILLNQPFSCGDIQAAFKLSLKDKNGNIIPVGLKSSKIKNNSQEFTFDIIIGSKVDGGVLVLENINKDISKADFNPTKIIKGQDGTENYFLDHIQFNDINYDPKSDATLNAIGNSTQTGMKVMSFIMVLMSITSAVALFKLFQMMDFMILFSVTHPRNFKKFLEIFSSNLLNDLPNVLIMFVDDECGEIREKFYEQEMSCQFLSNCGQILFLLMTIAFGRFLVFLIKTGSYQKGRPQTKFWFFMNRLDGYFNVEFMVTMMDMVQLDIYLGVFLQIDDFKNRSKVSIVNIAFACCIGIAFLFIKVYLFFISTRIAIIRGEERQAEIGYKKHYYNFLFLNKDTDCKSWYSKHQMILNLVKDPCIALFLVLTSKIPFLQIGSILSIFCIFTYYEIMTQPNLDKWQNYKNSFAMCIYLTTTLIFLILATAGNHISDHSREMFIGIPLIITNSLLVLFNVYLSVRQTYLDMKEKCKKKKIDEGEKTGQEISIKDDGLTNISPSITAGTLGILRPDNNQVIKKKTKSNRFNGNKVLPRVGEPQIFDPKKVNKIQC